MGILRNLYRKALNHELGVVGDDLVELQDSLEALIERFHRLQARIGMRELRSGAKVTAVENNDLDSVLRRAAAAKGRAPGGGDGWPETEH